MREFSDLSADELTTMKCIWDAKKPVTAHEIICQLKDTYGLDYKESTVYIFLRKLKENGYVDSCRDTFYYPVCDEEEYRRAQLSRVKDFWIRNSATATISELFRLKLPGLKKTTP